MDPDSIAIGRSFDQEHGCHPTPSSFETRFLSTVRWRCQLADERSQETGSPVDPWVTSKEDSRECESPNACALMWLQLTPGWISYNLHGAPFGSGRGGRVCGLRCRIGDGALSGESKPFAALSLGVGHQFISLWSTGSSSTWFDRVHSILIFLTGSDCLIGCILRYQFTI